LSRNLVRQKFRHCWRTLYVTQPFCSHSSFSPYLHKVEQKGIQCTYPDYASPECSCENVCDFACADGFTKSGASCVCPSPKSVCNGKCGSYPQVRTSLLLSCVSLMLICPKGCSSALPRPPKMTRRSIVSSRNKAAPGSRSRGLLAIDGNVSLNSGGPPSDLLASLSTTPDGSGIDIDIDSLVDQVLKSLDITGGTQSTNLEVTLDICVGAGVADTLLGTITKLVNSLLFSLLGTTDNLKTNSSCSSPVDPNTISLDLHLCGSSGDSLETILPNALNEVVGLLNRALTDLKIVTDCIVDGSGCPPTPTLSSANLPLPSPPTWVADPDPSVSPSPSSTLNGVNLTGLLGSFLGQVQGILARLGLNSANYALNATTDSTVGVFVELSGSLNSVDGLSDTVLALVDDILSELLGIVATVPIGPNPTSSPTPSDLSQGDHVVVTIDLGTLLNDTPPNASTIVNDVSLGVSGVLANLLNLNVVANVDGGDGCGCDQSRWASAKTRRGAGSPFL
jgi:hypothetical protein